MNRTFQPNTAILLACLAALSSMAAAPDHDHAHDEKPTSAKVRVDDAHSDDHDNAEGDGHDHNAHAEHADEVKLSPDAIKTYGIRVGTVEERSLAQSFLAPARIAFNTDAMAHVGSSVTGRVSDLRIKLGDTVKKGDLLAIVDSPELGEAQSDFLLKRTAIDTARPAVQLAKDAYERSRLLLDQSQGIALSEVQKRETDWRAAEGALRAAEASATAAENKLHLYGMSQDAIARLLSTGEIAPQYRVLAPIDGHVLEREVTLGELVRPDRDALMIIANLSTVWVIADVPEARIGSVGKGSVARVKVAAMNDVAMEGTVTYIAPALDPNTRSAKVRIEIQDDSGLLRPGMFAQAMILPPATSGARKVLAVPEEAVHNVEGGPAVFVSVDDEPGTFELRSISVGRPVAGFVEVLSGLYEGESIVISGGFILKAELGKAGAAHEH